MHSLVISYATLVTLLSILVMVRSYTLVQPRLVSRFQMRTTEQYLRLEGFSKSEKCVNNNTGYREFILDNLYFFIYIWRTPWNEELRSNFEFTFLTFAHKTKSQHEINIFFSHFLYKLSTIHRIRMPILTTYTRSYPHCPQIGLKTNEFCTIESNSYLLCILHKNNLLIKRLCLALL